MKCSTCGETIKPVVALDIDGTLADWYNHFLGYAGAYLNVDLAQEIPMGFLYDGTESFKEWFCVVFGTDATTFRQIKLAYRQGAMKRLMEPYSDAAALAKACQESGAEVWITTARPHDRYDRVDPDTREWLRRNDIPYDGLIYSDHKLEDLAERVDPSRVCFVLDDLRESVEAAEDLFNKGCSILRKTQWNRNVSWPVEVYNLLDARAMAAAHIQDWIISHQFDDLPTTGE